MKSMWETIAGFDEQMSGPGDETEFFFRASKGGFKGPRLADAPILYRRRPPDSLTEFLRVKYRNGVHHSKVASLPGGDFLKPSPGILVAFLYLIRSTLAGGKHFWSREGRRRWVGGISYRLGWLSGSIRIHSSTI